MRFQQINLKNWRVYYGDVSIKFVATGSGNLWVIDGNNGYGKTSLLLAIQWALYQRENKPTLTSYINRKALQEGSAEIAVRLLFEHRNKQYNLLRRAYLPDPSNLDGGIRIEGHLYEDGRPVDDLQARIDQMLPQDASQFFFFDGLEISRYAQISHSSETREAIEKVLGIPAVRNARSDIAQAISRWERELEEELKRDAATQQVFEEMERTEAVMKAAEDKRKQLHQEIESAENVLHKVEEDLGKAQEVQHLFHDKDMARQRFQTLEEHLVALRNEEERFLKHIPMLIVERELRKVHTKWQLRASARQGQEFQKAGIKARIEELERIVRDGECLCGNELATPGEQNRIKQRLSILQSELQRLRETAAASQTGSDNTILYFERLDSLLNSLRHIPRDATSLFSRRTQLEEEHAEVTQRYESLEEQIGNLDQAELQGLIERRSEIRTELRHLRERLETAADEVKEQEKEIARLRREMETLGQSTPRRQALEGNIRLAKATLRAIEGYIDDLVAAQRSRIEDETTKIHRLVTNKPDTYSRVALRQDYSLDLIDKAGRSIPTDGISAGEREALAFSFIAGLNLASDANAPIVMDTPFGHLDTVHRTNILKALPQLPTQVILLATDRDLPPSEMPTYAPFLAGEFVINYLDGVQASRIEPAK